MNNIILLLLIYTFATADCVPNNRIDLVTIPPSNERRRYKASWFDLDKRPLPKWYDRSKIGVFLHWGIYSVPGVGSEWFWENWKDGANSEVNNYMRNNYPPHFTYQDFAPMFTAEFFNATDWARLLKNSGAKYVVLTSKHHDGFALYPSEHSFSWNSVDVGPRRDIVGELSKAVRRENMKFGVYHSLYEWFNPVYLADKRSRYVMENYTRTKLIPDIQQLVTNYKPSVLWADGDWEAHDTYWNAKELLAWLYNDSPVRDEIVVNDRWGIDIPCHHGDFYNCKDRYNPGVLQKHKWENAFTIDKKSWGHRKNIALDDVMTTKELFRQVIMTVSCGGNALINVGPTQQGTIIPIFEERLLTLGEWLLVNGRAIYDTSPWFSQNDSLSGDVWYTCRSDRYDEKNPIDLPEDDTDVKEIFAIVLNWPTDNILRLKDISDHISKHTVIKIFGYDKEVESIIEGNKVTEIRLPLKQKVKSKYAWVVQFITTGCGRNKSTSQ